MTKIQEVHGMAEAFEKEVRNDGLKRSYLIVPIDRLYKSEWCPRKTADPEHVERLAERIKQKGYDPGRAMWVEKDDEGNYEVFAGSVRLEASRLAGLTEVPVLVYKGLDDENKVRLICQNNEDDEMYVPVGSE